MNPNLHIAIVDDEVEITWLLANGPQGYRYRRLHRRAAAHGGVISPAR